MYLTAHVMHGACPLKDSAVLTFFLRVMAVMQHCAGAGAGVIGDPQAVFVALGQAEHPTLVYILNVAGTLDSSKAAVASISKWAIF